MYKYSYIVYRMALELILACKHKKSKAALKLIESNSSKPELIDDKNNTALMYASKNEMTDVILKLNMINK